MVFNLKRILRSDLENLAPYQVQPVKNGLVRLDANENPFDFPLFLVEEIYRQLKSGSFARYPDDLAGELRKAIAQFTGVPAEGIIPGNGSDELILNLCLAVGAGAQVAIAPPTFSMYRVNSLVAGAVPVEAPRKKEAGFALDLDRLCEIAANEKTRLIFLCSPNNPTGNAVPVAETAALLERSAALVAVDEAYIEFGGETCLPLLEKYENLVILRTFSKAFGLAGLRVGYLLGRPGVVKELLRVKQPFNLSTFAQVAACTVLAHQEEFRKQAAVIRRLKDLLAQELAALPGVEAYPSEANFILFRTRRPAQEVFHRLAREGVLVRNLHGPGLEECLRVTVGRQEENEIFLAKMKKICL